MRHGWDHTGYGVRVSHSLLTQGVSGALRCVTLMRCAVLRWCVTTVGYGAVLHRCVTAVHYGVLQHYVTTVHDGSALQYYVTVVRYTAVCYGALRCVTLVRYAVADGTQ